MIIRSVNRMDLFNNRTRMYHYYIRSKSIDSGRYVRNGKKYNIGAQIHVHNHNPPRDHRVGITAFLAVKGITNNFTLWTEKCKFNRGKYVL